MVYKTSEWDGNLKTRLRNGKGLEEIIEVQLVKETLGNIAAMVTEEDKPLTAKTQTDNERVSEKGALKDTLTIDDLLANEDEPTTAVQRLIRDKDPEGKLQEWRDRAATRRNELVRLIKEPESYNSFAEIIKDSAVFQMKETLQKNGGYIGVMYNPACSGEPTTHPHLRACSLRDDHLKKLVKGVPAVPKTSP